MEGLGSVWGGEKGETLKALSANRRGRQFKHGPLLSSAFQGKRNFHWPRRKQTNFQSFTLAHIKVGPVLANLRTIHSPLRHLKPNDAITYLANTARDFLTHLDRGDHSARHRVSVA